VLQLGPNARIVGIDVSAEQLDRNTGIHESVVADIQTVELPEASFDLVLCWDVLEHLSSPQMALDNLLHALRRGGLLVVGGPDPFSLKGLVTWLTPYWVHRLVYARSGWQLEPFRIYRRVAASPRSIMKWAAERQLACIYATTYESSLQSALRQRLKMEGRVWTLLERSTSSLTGGLVKLSHTDFMLALQR
jgi:2-polyprenyl-3-methyl-5-hydroxy-6-metoxy-1,4-benzoquinol methylase